jgi:N-acetylglucosaminyl-diphospho-decaprenol L-rhamnosyltransferase
MTKNPQDITIIIVTYKSAHIVSEALKSIVGQGYRIIIVDNGSNDNLKDCLQQKYSNSGIELVILENNCGFGKANNFALHMVETKYAFLLNPDAIINAQSINNLVEESEKDIQIAIAGPFPTLKIKPDQDEIGKEISNYKKSCKVFYEDNKIIQTDFMCGGYLLLKMEIFKNIGFFDENLFLYWEDYEISKRSVDKGYRNILVKSSNVFHCEQNSTKTKSKLEKDRMLFFRNWHMGWGKAYLERKRKSYYKVCFKVLQKLSSFFLYLLLFNKGKAIIYGAKFLGLASNLVGIDCFNQGNRVPKVKSINKI